MGHRGRARGEVDLGPDPGEARQCLPDVAYAALATPVREPVELHLLWPRRSGNPALRRVLDVLDEFGTTTNT